LKNQKISEEDLKGVLASGCATPGHARLKSKWPACWPVCHS